jgi:L-glyceraldehyde 3-phosphate reductase
VVEGLRQLASETEQSMVHLALSWALRRPKITSVLIGARHPRHVDQAFDALDAPLAADILHRLDQISDPSGP